MNSFGNRLLLLHYWKREFKATDGGQKCATFKEKGLLKYVQLNIGFKVQ